MSRTNAIDLWIQTRDTGLSSETLAAVLCPERFQYMRGAVGSFGWRAPSDTSDVGRCVRLLEHLEREGVPMRDDEWDGVVSLCAEWAPLVPRWADITAAFHEDVVAQGQHRAAQKRRRAGEGKRKNTFPPSRTYWLVKTLSGEIDPYANTFPHPFEVVRG